MTNTYVMPYSSAHSRVREERGSASNYACVGCGDQASHWAYQHAAGDSELVAATGALYSPNPADYAPMCASCHKKFDNEHKRRAT